MDDVILHPLDALFWRKKYDAIKAELADIIRANYSADIAEEMISEAFAGKINFPDAYVLKRLLQRYRPQEILEVGSFVGFSTRWSLEIAEEWGGRVTSVDPNIRHRKFEEPGAILRKLNARHIPNRLSIHQAFFGTPGDVYRDYAVFPPKHDREYVDKLLAARECIGREWKRRFDFIFIDGDHDYLAVMENFVIARQLLRPGGCIAFHDALSWKGVRKALSDIAAKNSASATVMILGKLDHIILQGVLNKFTDGIGFFRLRSYEGR